MNATEIVGWTYEADAHCDDCAYEKFGAKLYDDQNPPEDIDGNPVNPIFAGAEHEDDEHCCDCDDTISDADE